VLPIRANEAQLRRLLLILTDNAIKYSPSGGRVTIAGSADGPLVTISVADTGAGLGLTIAKQIAERHGAHLGVESEIGRGSTFSIRFPNPAR
jgi:signal transduction histidine kinase